MYSNPRWMSSQLVGKVVTASVDVVGTAARLSNFQRMICGMLAKEARDATLRTVTMTEVPVRTTIALQRPKKYRRNMVHRLTMGGSNA